MRHTTSREVHRLAGLALLGLACGMQPAWATGYTLVYSQITASSEATFSSTYRAEEAVLTQGVNQPTQTSPTYSVNNAVGKESVLVPVELSQITIE